MKIRVSRSPGTAGNTLLITLGLALVIGVALGSYLTLAQNQFRSVARAQDWNAAIILSEAGVEESMALLNMYRGTSTDLRAWTNAAAANGWDQAGDVFHLKRQIGPNAFEAWITNNPAQQNQTIKCVGEQAGSAPGTSLGSATVARRAVLTTTTGLLTNSSMFLMAILTKGSVTLSGQGYVDSFDSLDPLHSNNGLYILSKRKDGGSVGSLLSNVVAITESGQAKIFGKAYTGPNGTYQLSGQAAIGSISWINGGHYGVEPGWFINNLNVQIPDAPPAPGATYLPLPACQNNVYTLSGNGSTAYYNLCNLSLASTKTLVITNGTVIVKASSISMSGQSAIIIAEGAKLVLYATGNLAFSGQGVVNSSGLANNCAVFGSSATTSINYSGQSDFVGTVYAPYANFTISGQGGLVGALITKTFKNSGQGNIHYDEALSKDPEGGGSRLCLYRIASWKEVKP